MPSNNPADLIGCLAKGIDPISGEILPDASPYNQPAVIRALFQAVHALEQPEAPVHKTPGERPGNAGKPWSNEEDQQLLVEFDSEIALKQIAASHARSRGAIHARLVKLGKLQP